MVSRYRRILIEGHPRWMVVATTQVMEAGVQYRVFHDAQGTGERREVYGDFVPFGQDRAHRAGGAAFRAAAREQQRVVDELVGRLARGRQNEADLERLSPLDPRD